jgi:Zn-dependent protease with chaperone function
MYLAQGRYQKAESTLMKSMGIAQRVLGKNHPDVKYYHKNQTWIAVLAIASIISSSLIGITFIFLVLKALEITIRNKSLLEVLPDIFFIALMGVGWWMARRIIRPLFALEWLFKKLQSLCKSWIRFFYNFATCRKR